MAEAANVLELDGARIVYRTPEGEIVVIPGLSLAIGRGEAFGLVGESGSGKSTAAFAIVGYLGPRGRITQGRILFEGRDLAKLDEAELRAIRGRRIAVVYQDPMSSLNPVMTIGRQLMEVPLIHEDVSPAEARARAVAMLGEVNFADPERIMERYPHQLSGGQQQRVVIAMALIGNPSLLIMDEPTTGLDVTVEAAVLDLVETLRRKHRMALLFISHNLGTVARICDRVGILYGGELVEEGPVRQVFHNPRHPYTRGLLEALPSVRYSKRSAKLRAIPGQPLSPRARPDGCAFAARCAYVDPARCTRGRIPSQALAGEGEHRVACLRAAELETWQRDAGGGVAPDEAAQRAALVSVVGLTKEYRARAGLFGGGGRPVQALRGVELDVLQGETLAIVGESGCGKSTLARVVSGLEVASGGSVRIGASEVARQPVEARPAALRRRLQMVFQNPDSTLNPSHSVGYAIGRALQRLRSLGSGEREALVDELLERVRLSPELARRRPQHLSGGQKQRVAIARALAGDPDIIVADEPVSALDASVQAAIINLLAELQEEHGTSLVFISHDLAAVRYLADHVAVMYLGKIVESGPVDAVFAPPHHPYTAALLSAVPEPDPDAARTRIILEGVPPSASAPPPGCPFASRCPMKLGEICDTTPPPVLTMPRGHRIACHLPAGMLAAIPATAPVHSGAA
jgi:peptide/nickel transport system ATP-binding protein